MSEQRSDEELMRVYEACRAVEGVPFTAPEVLTDAARVLVGEVGRLRAQVAALTEHLAEAAAIVNKLPLSMDTQRDADTCNRLFDILDPFRAPVDDQQDERPCTCGGRPYEIGGAEHRPGCGGPTKPCRWCGSENPDARHGYGENRECLWPCNHEVLNGEAACGACSTGCPHCGHARHPGVLCLTANPARPGDCDCPGDTTQPDGQRYGK